MYDFIIVGQGIAGTLLALELIEHNQSIFIIDKFHPNSSSNIATGIVNPITGRKLVKTWMIDELLPVCDTVYQQIEKNANTQLMFRQPVYKIFSSQDDINAWNKRKLDIEYKPYIGDMMTIDNPSINNKLGTGIINNCFWLDVPLFIAIQRSHFIKHNLLSDESLDFNELKVGEHIEYKGKKAKQIIFCDGYKAIENPFFNFIPFTTAKGEFLVFKAEDLKLDFILNKNFIILPKGNDTYSIGSTFLWNDIEESMTDQTRKELTEKLHKLFNCNFTVIEERAGIRPTIKDRRPVIGRHPVHSNVITFNGLGTKGVSLTPYFSKHLVQHLLFDKKIIDEVSINRFLDIKVM